MAWVDTRCNYKCPYTTKGRDLTQKAEDYMEAEKNLKVLFAGLKDGGRDHEPKIAFLESGKSKETDCQLEAPEG